MQAHIARTVLLHSSAHCDFIGEGPQVADNYRGAHADGYDYADYQNDQMGWAKMVWDVAGTAQEGYLFICAARDYADYSSRTEQPLPRGKWCEAHVAGQIDRALEIADSV